jgi:hypothetical protein
MQEDAGSNTVIRITTYPHIVWSWQKFEILITPDL